MMLKKEVNKKWMMKKIMRTKMSKTIEQERTNNEEAKKEAK